MTMTEISSITELSLANLQEISSFKNAIWFLRDSVCVQHQYSMWTIWPAAPFPPRVAPQAPAGAKPQAADPNDPNTR